MSDKYQKSIYNLVHLKKAKMDFDGIYINREKLGQDIEVLWELYNNYQKLIDKETPKKPKRKRLYYNCHNGECDKTFIHYCPVCDFCSVEKDYANYCPNCGQMLDWSETNE